MKNKKSAIAVELGTKGGQKTLKLKGIKHYKEMAQKRWNKKTPVDKSPLTSKR